MGLYRNPVLPVLTSALPGGHCISIPKYRDDTRDWRKLPPDSIAKHLAELEAAITEHALHGVPAGLRNEKLRGKHSDFLKQLEGLVAAVAVGTLQACHEMSYWAPSFGHSDGFEQISEMRMPMSRLYKATPATSSIGEARSTPELRVLADANPLSTCEELALKPGLPPRVALVRFTAAGDRRSLTPSLTDHREAQMFTRTTYLQALLDMERHLHTEPVATLDAGGLIYTTDVSILRGPIQGGAKWVADAATIDVIWVALQRVPMSDSQGQYARLEEKAAVAATIDRIFACAAANGVDALVFPPPGVGGAAGCHHPAEDAGDLLRKAYLQHANIIPTVCVCQEYPGQVHSAWEPFAAALQRFRAPIYHHELVPMTASPYIRPGWEAKKEKKKKGVPSCVSAGLEARSRLGPPMSARGDTAVLGSTGRAIVC